MCTLRVVSVHDVCVIRCSVYSVVDTVVYMIVCMFIDVLVCMNMYKCICNGVHECVCVCRCVQWHYTTLLL